MGRRKGVLLLVIIFSFGSAQRLVDKDDLPTEDIDLTTAFPHTPATTPASTPASTPLPDDLRGGETEVVGWAETTVDGLDASESQTEVPSTDDPPGTVTTRLTTLPVSDIVEEPDGATVLEIQDLLTTDGDVVLTLPPGDDVSVLDSVVVLTTVQSEPGVDTVTDGRDAISTVHDDGVSVLDSVMDGDVTDDVGVTTISVTDGGYTIPGEDSAMDSSGTVATVQDVFYLDSATNGEYTVTSTVPGDDAESTVLTAVDSVTDEDEILSTVQDSAVTGVNTVTDEEEVTAQGGVTGEGVMTTTVTGGLLTVGVTDGDDVTAAVTGDEGTAAVIDGGETEATDSTTAVSHDTLEQDLEIPEAVVARDPSSSTPSGDLEEEETITPVSVTLETDLTPEDDHQDPVSDPPLTEAALDDEAGKTTKNLPDDNDDDDSATMESDDSNGSDYDLIVETVISTATIYFDDDSLQHLGTSRRFPRTVSADLRATPAQLNDVEMTEQYRGFLSRHYPPSSLTTYTTIVDHSNLRKTNRKSDPQPDIDDIIKGIVQLLGGNVKVTAAEVPQTRLTTFGNLDVTSTRINNRGPPRLTHIPYGILNSPVQTRPPIRRPVSSPANLPNLRPLPGRPQFVANTRPPFLVPLPPSLASRPLPPLQRPYATGIPLPIDLLPNSDEVYDTQPEITVNPVIPGFPDYGDKTLASRPTAGESPHTTESSQTTPTLLHMAPTSLIPPPPPQVDTEEIDNITTFATITSTTQLVAQILSDVLETSTSVSSIEPETSTTNSETNVATDVIPSTTSVPEVSTTSVPISQDTAAATTTTTTTTTPPSQTTSETYLLPSMLDPTSTVTSTSVLDQEPQPTSTITTSTSSTTLSQSSATPSITTPTPLLSIPRLPTPSYRPTGPPPPSLSHPRPGVVLDDSQYRPGQIITGTVVPYDVGGPGDIFDVTVSAHQGFGPPIRGPPFRPRPPNSGQPYLSQGIAQGPLVTTPVEGNNGFVSIDGRKTYFDLFPTTATHDQEYLQPPSQQSMVGTGVGVVIPEVDIPLDSSGPPNNQGGYYPQPSAPQPAIPPPTPPTPHPQQPTPHPQQPTTPTSRPTRKPYNRRPTQPSIRIDTCIVGDDSTCQEQLGEVCRTEEEVSSCYCKPGTARRRPRTPCKRIISLYMSLKVDRVGDQRIVWGGNYYNPESQEYRLLEWEARHAISNAMSKTPLSSAYMGNTVHKFYSLGGKVIVNSTINLEDLPSTRSRNIRHTLQRQIIQVIQSHANNVGDSAIWVDGPLNPIPDVSDVNECNEATLHDCHVHASCINEFGTFTCRCLPGYTDRFSDDPEQVGRKCESCSSDYCNKRGDCHIQDGHKVCQCRGSYYGTRCEIDGEVLGVAVGASVAAVVIIVLTLIFLCMWSRRWKAQDRKTEVLARGAALGGFAVNVQHKGSSSTAHQYGATLEDRMRWAQLADTLSSQNIYAQQQQGYHHGDVGGPGVGAYTASSRDYLTSAVPSTPFSIYNRVTRAISNSTMAAAARDGGGGLLSRIRNVFGGRRGGGARKGKERRPPYMMSQEPSLTLQQLMALHTHLSSQPEQLRGVGGPSSPPTAAATPTPLFQHQRQMAASSSGYASLGTLGSTASPQYGHHQYPPQQFGLQHLNPMSHLTSMQQQQQQQQQLHKQSAFGAQSTYGQYGPASFTMSQGGVSRAPTMGARTPVPLHDMMGAATIGPMGGGTVAPSGLESSEDELDRPYHLPRPKSRVSLGDASDIYYEPDDLTTTLGPPDRPPPPIPKTSHPQTYNFAFLH
ncbi:uncharacterized protein LOC121879718 isoform X2 [Homarus americanus]|uniref:uncharacterized protein LOC121879718 isoform X2 n=1 Tax=Homarus americanus TaxID=6706 RepID=UPI001C43DD57|nr:uncharacterized protein LOC121879718 isoform X2 [Homarus americanus]